MRHVQNLVAASAAAALFLLVACGGLLTEETEKMSSEQLGAFHDLSATDIDGQPRAMRDFEGEVLLVVNVASECGFTKQYAGLQELHEEFAGRGFRVLGFPCDDFGGQEPGSEEQIKAFCESRFGVTFPLFAKVQVKEGPDQSPLYAHLGGATGELPGWNFGKYLVGRDGSVLGFFPSNVSPGAEELRQAVERAL